MMIEATDSQILLPETAATLQRFTTTALPITVVVCTLNEEKNIAECLLSIFNNNPAEVIVVDAQSTDSTVKIAKFYGAIVAVCACRGLAYQRELGTQLARQPYVAFVDADDVLDTDCLSCLYDDLLTFECAAVQAISRSYSSRTYWERAMESLNHLNSRQPGPTKMVGRPALYKRKALLLVGIDRNWGNIGNEDTDLAIRFEKSNQKMRIGSGFSSRKHARSLWEWLPKWAKYGKGDAKLIVKYPEKRRSIISHLLFNYPFTLSIEAIRKGYGRYVPFYMLFGLARFAVMISQLIRPGKPWFCKV